MLRDVGSLDARARRPDPTRPDVDRAARGPGRSRRGARGRRCSRCSASTSSTGRRPARTRCCSCVTGATTSRPRASVPSGSHATRPGRTPRGRRRWESRTCPCSPTGTARRRADSASQFELQGMEDVAGAQRVPDRGRYGQGLVDARERDAGRGRRDRGGFVALALVLYAACALWATWPAVQHSGGRYLARPAAGDGEAAAGDHLQLGWAFWLPGHQLEHGPPAVGRPVHVPARGDGVAEPAGVAARNPVLAAARTVREHLGVQPRSCCSRSSPPGRSPAGGCVPSGSRVAPPSPAASCSRSRRTGSASRPAICSA